MQYYIGWHMAFLCAAISMYIGFIVVLIFNYLLNPYESKSGKKTNYNSYPVKKTVDTTGAGDTFLGAFLAARDGGADPEAALRQASAAAAIQVTRPGAADAIPTAVEVAAFLQERGA